VRTFLARHPLVYWLVVAAVVALAVDVTVGARRAVDDARRRWGEQREVWVAESAHDPGDVIVAARRTVPVAVVPDDALQEPPASATAMQHVSRGEVLTVGDVGNGPFALLPAGWHGVAFAADDTTLRVGVGDHVSIVAEGATVVDHAVVVEVAERSVTVGVPAADAPAAALASRQQTAALTLHRP
jgi:hypothetical protein